MSPDELRALIRYRLAKSKEMLAEAGIQIENQLWKLAANRYYYAAFHVIAALLATREEMPRTHKGLRQRFHLLFVSTGLVPKNMGDLLSELFDLRHSGDYDDLIRVDKEMVLRIGPETEVMISFVEGLVVAGSVVLAPVADEFMQAAVAEARLGRSEGGIPIGSVLVRDGQIIARGHNKRVQEKNPILHGEMDCLNNAGRMGSYKGTTIYSTLMPCYMCAGTIVQFKIKKVIVGESHTFSGARAFMESHGVEVIDLDLPECVQMMEEFIAAEPELWNEDIGE